jgi:hypothetical protein
MSAQYRTKQCACGQPIIFEDATCTIRHPKPHCAFFELAMKRFNMKPRAEPGWVFSMRPDGSKVERKA